MERAAGDFVPAQIAKEIAEPGLRIGSVGILHGRAGVAQAPPRRECRAAGQRRVARHHVPHRRPENHIEIEIAAARLEAPVRPMIGVDFLAQIEGGVGQIIVEQPHGAPAKIGPDGEVERNVLVKRVGCLRVVAERVGGAHPQAAAGLVRLAALLAEAVIMVRLVARQVMREARPPALVTIGLGLPVLQDGLESGLLAGPEIPGQRKRRAAQLDLHQRRFNCDGGLGLRGGPHLGAWKPGQIEAVAAVDCVLPGKLRRKRPGARRLQPFRRDDQHPRQCAVQERTA